MAMRANPLTQPAPAVPAQATAYHPVVCSAHDRSAQPVNARRGGMLGSLLLLVAVVHTAPARASGVEIPLRLINGKPCARCTLHGPRVSVPANVVIDLGSRVPLLIHDRTAKLLQVGRGVGLELRFDNLTLRDVPCRAMGLPALEELTREYAAELGEIPAAAVVGLPAFARFAVELDIEAGVLRLLPAAETDASEAAIGETIDEHTGLSRTVLLYQEESHSYWLEAIGPDNFRLRVRFATSDYDTLIDSTTTDLLGAPGGELEQLDLGGINVARYVAPRPRDLSTTPEPHPDVILGTNFLAHFRVTVDAVNRRMAFVPTQTPQFPAEERAYFVALVEEDPETIEAFLIAHPASRLAPEAAAVLCELRLDAYPPDRIAFKRAVRLRATAVQPHRRAGDMLARADEMLHSARADKHARAREILEIGLEYAPQGVNGLEAHHLRARLGLVALRANDLKQARRHLLSAAFGLPKDAMVNLWMGELYERMGKLTRAWSRYLQAAISRDMPPAALEGLDRLNRNPAFRTSFTMVDAEQLLEGRTQEFHPAGRFRPDGDAPTDRSVRLVELFTGIDVPATLAAELAFGGLGEYFEDRDVALVAYHVSLAEADPLTSAVGTVRAAYYGIESVPVALFDGGDRSNAAGDDGDVERIFAEYVAASAPVTGAASPWRLDGSVSHAKGGIIGTLTLDGPAAGADLRLHALLCEQAVMVPGANALVLHRYVARGALSPAEGFRVPAGAGQREFELRTNTASISAELEHTVDTLESERDISFLMKPTFVDAGSCSIVAFLQEQSSKRVIAACALDVPGGESGRP
ncbi:MAG: hypothetical protein GY842_15535 [bacterium]|nr:hypothetical protein [bacterium]